MPTRAALAEDDAHRVLQLVRGASATTKRAGKGKPTRKPTTTKAPPDDILHRHRHIHSATSATPPASLAQTKTRALMAVYGLRHTASPATLKVRGDRGDNNDAEDDALAERTRRELLEARRRTYRDHFSGLQATYGPSGRPKLETLIDAAMDAKRRGYQNKHTALAVGAAVLTSANRIYVAARVDSTLDAKLDVCAERAVLLKLTEQQARGEVIEALVVCSDQRGLLPVPCGACRELLAGFGDFPVFLLNAENDSRETRSFELFPLARDASYTALATRQAAEAARQAKTQQDDDRPHKTNSRPEDARDWTCEQVAAWVRDVVELPQYVSTFADKRVDGATLWLLTDADLQLLLGVVHPLHRRRLLLHLDRVRDRALLEHGVDFAQLADYVAVLDRDRLDVVAQLKQTFDRLDANRDGRLDSAELARAMRALGLDASQALAAQQLLEQASEADGGVSFPSFVRTFAQLAQLPAGETRDATGSSVPPVDLEGLRGTFDKADTNGSGALDEGEVAALLRSLGRDDCERRAREWFASADGDGDARLSFAEFVLRFAQLTNLDLSAVRGAFDGVSREAGGQRRCSVDALARALPKLFAHADASDVRAWCAKRLWANAFTTATNADNGADTDKTKSKMARSKTLAFADFALACVQYGNALRLRVAQLVALQRTLGANDALCHRSRIVQLQQSGHVRLCVHPGGGGEGQGGEQESDVSLGERRRWQREQEKATTRRSRGRDDDDDGKHGDEVDDEDGKGTSRQDRVVATFERFARQHQEKKKTTSSRTQRRERDGSDSDSDDDGKRQHSDEDEEDGDGATLNAVEAAQALLELGAAWSRDQVVRFLDREGFGLRRAIGRRDFVRVATRLRAMEQATTTASGGDAHRELWAAIGSAAQAQRQKDKRAESPRKPVPRGEAYDAYLCAKHAQKHSRTRTPSRDATQLQRERRRCRDDEMARASTSRSSRPRRRSRSSASSSSAERSDRESDTRRARSRGRSKHRSPSRGRSTGRRRRQGSRSSGSTSTASSTCDSSSSPRRRARKATSRGRSHSRGPSHRRGADSDRFFRGFEVGDRVASRTRGAGTLVRLYRDYFVADVRFDSGESAKNVELSHLKRLRPGDDDHHSQRDSEAKRRALFVVGAVVRVAHKRTRAAWRRGTIQRCRTDGTFDVVANECGEQELLARVPLAQLALVGKPVVYASGASVTVKRRREYLRGVVALCRTNGTYDVRVGGGETLREVAWELLAPDEAGDEEEEEEEDEEATSKTKKSTTTNQRRKHHDDEDDGKANDDDGDAYDDEFEAPEFRVGDRVEARFQGLAAYYGGRVTRVHGDGSCDIAYDDGDAESRVRASLIRAATKAKATAKPATKTSASRRGGDRDGYDDDFESD